MASCSDTGVPVLDALVGFFKFLGDPIGTIMQAVADFVLGAAIEVYASLVTSIPTMSWRDGGPADKINAISQWIVVYLAVGSLLFASARMAIERRGEAGTTALKGILRVILVATAATTVLTAAAGVSDRYAQHLFAAGAEEHLKGIGECTDGSTLQAFLMLILAFLLLIAGIIQTILLYIRLGVMVLLLGTLPIAAAASMTDWGSGWWRKHLGWLIAWLLYKPAAALVMYAGSVLITSDSDEIHERIAGIGIMLLSAVSLPALLRLVVPATAALGGASESKAMSAVGGGLATGARSIAGGSGSNGRTGPSGSSSSADGGAAGASGKGGPSGSTGAKGTGGGGAGQSGASGAGAGAGAGGGGAAASGAASKAAAAAGPVGAIAGAAITVASVVASTASGAVDDADGSKGNNQ
ncbi:hypothetical protein [Streptomyces hirsutus]|uniref:hypothetical protein n=1 Tax=Streptomyces hirsutus TaxID=35620 RepID=UPI0006E24492|nr:hypothetical protein [Streptomyces hirsutus]